MNIKLEKVGIWKKFLMVHHDFLCKKLWVFHRISNKWNFPNIGKSWEKKFKKSSKKSKIKNRENQFVFEQNVGEVYARARAHLVIVDFSFTS